MKQLSKKATKKILKVKTKEEDRALADDIIVDTWKERKIKEEELSQ